MSCPIPAGVFTPVFTLGAVFGRLYGYTIIRVFGISTLRMSLSLIISDESIYAIIGAAAVTSSVTRTLSVAMIVFELNGQLSHMMPVLIGVLISYHVSNSLSLSVFDVLLNMKGLPYLPGLKS